MILGSLDLVEPSLLSDHYSWAPVSVSLSLHEAFRHFIFKYNGTELWYLFNLLTELQQLQLGKGGVTSSKELCL